MGLAIAGDSNETVAFPRNGLNESWLSGIFLQRGPNLPDGGVDAVLGVDEHVLTPEPRGDLRPGDYVAILFSQQDEQLHGDALDLYDASVTTKLKAVAVQLELAKFEAGASHGKLA